MPEKAPEPLRVFVEPGGYRWGNLGDTMMLDVALRRLRSFWPDASITVHCFEPERLRLLDASAVALDPSSAQRWSRIPRFLRPAVALVLGWFGRNSGSRRFRLFADYLEAVRSADLVLLSGAGGLTDSFAPHALVLLQTIELAIDAGAVTAIMGQGIGPISDAELLQRAAAVLPRVDFIALREGVSGPSLLASIGVPPERIAITGDDTIALAYDARPETLGTSLGINLRAASYSGLDDDLLPGIGRVVTEAAASHGTKLLPVPISSYSGEDDLETVRRMIGDSSERAHGAEVTSEPLLRIVSQCRVVVTGSYHGGVLALSMGIPAVAVAGSAYYIDKFHGLTDQFGPACRVVLTSDPDFYPRLRSAIDEAWASAEATRETLLQHAARQIESNDLAYRHVFDLVEARRPFRRRL